MLFAPPPDEPAFVVAFSIRILLLSIVSFKKKVASLSLTRGEPSLRTLTFVLPPLPSFECCGGDETSLSYSVESVTVFFYDVVFFSRLIRLPSPGTEDFLPSRQRGRLDEFRAEDFPFSLSPLLGEMLLLSLIY